MSKVCDRGDRLPRRHRLFAKLQVTQEGLRLSRSSEPPRERGKKCPTWNRALEPRCGAWQYSQRLPARNSTRLRTFPETRTTLIGRAVALINWGGAQALAMGDQLAKVMEFVLVRFGDQDFQFRQVVWW